MPSDRSVAKFEKVYGSQTAANFRMISQLFGRMELISSDLGSRMIVISIVQFTIKLYAEL